MSDVTHTILNHIFGSTVGDLYTEGLVDAVDDNDFQQKLESLVKSWKEMPVSSTANVHCVV